MKKKPKILIVDDDHDTLDLLEIILYKKFEVITALNGFEALASIKEHAPDLVVTDIMMPVMDGVRFLNRLRRDVSIQKVPVIAITSFTGNYPEKNLISLGFDGVIPKPPDETMVLAMIAGLLAKNVDKKEHPP